MEEQNLFSTKEAARYLGMSVQNVKHHVYKTGLLVPIRLAHRFIFTRQQLDEFARTKRKSGPKPKPGEA